MVPASGTIRNRHHLIIEPINLRGGVKKMKNRTFSLGIFLFAITMGGCATSPLKYYPDFPKQKQGVAKVTMLEDIIVVEDIAGNIDSVNVDENKVLGNTLLKIFNDELNQKGYLVEKTMLSSIGLTLNPNNQYQVVGAPSTGNPPFYIDEAIIQDPDMKQKLTTLFNSLGTYIKKEGEPSKVIPDAPSLRIGTESDALLVILAGGRKVSLGKQIGQGVLTTMLTLGTVATWQTSTTVMQLYIVDLKSGEVLWSDTDFQQYEPSEDHLRRQAKRIIERLPAR